MAERCAEYTWPSGAYHSVRCPHPGKVEHEGRWYCGKHSPEAEQKRQDRAAARHQERYGIRDARERRRNACEQAFYSCGRHIATEQISEGLVFRLIDHIKMVHNHTGYQETADLLAVLQIEEKADD